MEPMNITQPVKGQKSMHALLYTTVKDNNECQVINSEDVKHFTMHDH
jgi:hypothetical protein